MGFFQLRHGAEQLLLGIELVVLRLLEGGDLLVQLRQRIGLGLGRLAQGAEGGLESDDLLVELRERLRLGGGQRVDGALELLDRQRILLKRDSRVKW
jgi:hypothetical protein